MVREGRVQDRRWGVRVNSGIIRYYILIMIIIIIIIRHGGMGGGREQGSNVPHNNAWLLVMRTRLAAS